MAKYLPKHLQSLGSIATKEAGYRYPTQGVRLTFGGDNYRAEATDGKMLARVDGACEMVESYPTIPALDTAPNGSVESIIPAKDWTAAFKAVPKKLNVLAVAQSERVTTLASPGAIAQPENIEGRWPATDQVIPKTKPLAQIAIDPKLLGKLLEVASHFGRDGYGIELRVHKTMIELRASNSNQQFTGLCVECKTE